MKKFRPSLLLFALVLSVVAVACREDDPAPNSTKSNPGNVYVNEWVLENMQYWYLWEDELNTASDKNESPDAYFESLLFEGDRFSWIQDNYQELLNSLKGINKEAGFEFVLYRDKENTANVIAQVVYVKGGSPAETAGLVRGDIISHINDTRLTVENYRSVLEDLDENFSIRYKSADPETETFSAEKSMTLGAIEFSENPNFLHKVIDIDDRKIGYYVYTFFAGGPTSESHVYDNEMQQIFSEFKSAGITDLVLDLRFNSGGSESSANNLASFIGSGVDNSKVFARREYNQKVTDEILKDPDLGEEFLTRKFSTKAENIGSQLTDNRVYVLTSSRSASASELVINALKPYMDVFIVGDTTYGKNVGSISLYEENDAKNTWGMQPIVVKIYNSLDQSDYDHGFTPNVLQKDNRLYLYSLGDVREVLLGHAIGQITGTSTAGRASERGEPQEIVGHSLDSKRRSFNLTIDLPK